MSAAEVNTLIYHYFLETGLHTAAFALRAEAKLPVSSHIAPGTLLAYLEKALLFTQIEAHIFTSAQHPGQRCVSDISLLGKHTCEYQNDAPSAKEEPASSAALCGHSGVITKVCWSPFSQVVLTSATDGSARLWRAENRLKESKAIAILPHLSKTGSVEPHVTALPWTVSATQPQGVAVTITQDGVARMWDSKGNLMQVLMEQQGIRLGKWNRLGTSLVTVGKDNSAALWNQSGALVKQCLPLDSLITCVDWLGDNEFLLGTESGGVFVTSPNQCQPAAIALHNAALRLLVCHAGADFFAAASDQAVCVWMLTGAMIMQHSVHATALAWNPKFTVLTIGLANGAIFSWDATSRTTVEALGKHEGAVTVLAYRTEGDLFASAAGDNRVVVWNLRDGRMLSENATDAPVTDM